MVKALRASSKRLMICPVKVAEIMRSSSQGMRDLKVSRVLVLRYGLSEGSMAAIFSMSSVVSSCRTSMASSMVTMPTSRPSVSTTGRARKSYLLRAWAVSSWSSRVWTQMKFRSMMSPMMSSSSARRMVRMESTPMRWR